MRALRSDFRALWRGRGLLALMTRREIAARHAGSVVGLGWVYAQPLLTMAAYYLLFDVVFRMRLGEGAPTQAVGVFLIAGMLPWMAFCDAVSRGMNSLIDAGGLLQKNPLPPVLFPARAVLASTMIYAPLILVMAVAYTPLHRFAPALLALPLLLVAQLALCLALAYALAILAAALRDTLQVVGFLLSIGIFAAPVLFPIERFPESFQPLLWLNPMTPLVLGYQSVLLGGGVPPSDVWSGLAVWVVIAALALDRLILRSREQLVDWL